MNDDTLDPVRRNFIVILLLSAGMLFIILGWLYNNRETFLYSAIRTYAGMSLAMSLGNWMSFVGLGSVILSAALFIYSKRYENE